MLELCHGCRDLSRLGLDWCEALTNVGLAALLTMLPSLSRLNVEGCKALSEAGIVEAVAAHVTTFGATSKFAELDLSWVNSASSEVVQQILAVCPALTVRDYYGDSYNRSSAGNVLEMLRQAGDDCVITMDADGRESAGGCSDDDVG